MVSRGKSHPRLSFLPRPRSGRHAAETGITLVEVVIAIGLFGLLFASLFGAFENLLTMNRLAKDMTRATMDAEEILFDLEKEVYADLRDYSPPVLDNLPAQSATVTVTSVSGGAIDPGDDLPSVVRLKVEMQWKNGSGDVQRVLLHTLRGDFQ